MTKKQRQQLEELLKAQQAITEAITAVINDEEFSLARALTAARTTIFNIN